MRHTGRAISLIAPQAGGRALALAVLFTFMGAASSLWGAPPPRFLQRPAQRHARRVRLWRGAVTVVANAMFPLRTRDSWLCRRAVSTV